MPTPRIWLVQFKMFYNEEMKLLHRTELRRNQQQEILGVMLVSHWKRNRRWMLWPLAVPCLFILIYAACTAPRSNRRNRLTFIISPNTSVSFFKKAAFPWEFALPERSDVVIQFSVACCSTLAPQKLHVPLTSCWTTKEKESQKRVHHSITYWLLF